MDRGGRAVRYRSITHLHYPDASFLAAPLSLGRGGQLPHSNFSFAILQQHAPCLVDYGNHSIYLLYAQFDRECTRIPDMVEI